MPANVQRPSWVALRVGPRSALMACDKTIVRALTSKKCSVPRASPTITTLPSGLHTASSGTQSFLRTGTRPRSLRSQRQSSGPACDAHRSVARTERGGGDVDARRRVQDVDLRPSEDAAPMASSHHREPRRRVLVVARKAARAQHESSARAARAQAETGRNGQNALTRESLAHNASFRLAPPSLSFPFLSLALPCGRRRRCLHSRSLYLRRPERAAQPSPCGRCSLQARPCIGGTCPSADARC